MQHFQKFKQDFFNLYSDWRNRQKRFPNTLKQFDSTFYKLNNYISNHPEFEGMYPVFCLLSDAELRDSVIDDPIFYQAISSNALNQIITGTHLKDSSLLYFLCKYKQMDHEHLLKMIDVKAFHHPYQNETPAELLRRLQPTLLEKYAAILTPLYHPSAEATTQKSTNSIKTLGELSVFFQKAVETEEEQLVNLKYLHQKNKKIEPILNKHSALKEHYQRLYQFTSHKDHASLLIDETKYLVIDQEINKSWYDYLLEYVPATFFSELRFPQLGFLIQEELLSFRIRLLETIKEENRERKLFADYVDPLLRELRSQCEHQIVIPSRDIVAIYRYHPQNPIFPGGTVEKLSYFAELKNLVQRINEERTRALNKKFELEGKPFVERANLTGQEIVDLISKEDPVKLVACVLNPIFLDILCRYPALIDLKKFNVLIKKGDFYQNACAFWAFASRQQGIEFLPRHTYALSEISTGALNALTCGDSDVQSSLLFLLTINGLMIHPSLIKKIRNPAFVYETVLEDNTKISPAEWIIKNNVEIFVTHPALKKLLTPALTELLENKLAEDKWSPPKPEFKGKIRLHLNPETMSEVVFPEVVRVAVGNSASLKSSIEECFAIARANKIEMPQFEVEETVEDKTRIIFKGQVKTLQKLKSAMSDFQNVLSKHQAMSAVLFVDGRHSFSVEYNTQTLYQLFADNKLFINHLSTPPITASSTCFGSSGDKKDTDQVVLNEEQRMQWVGQLLAAFCYAEEARSLIVWDEKQHHFLITIPAAGAVLTVRQKKDRYDQQIRKLFAQHTIQHICSRLAHYLNNNVADVKAELKETHLLITPRAKKVVLEPLIKLSDEVYQALPLQASVTMPAYSPTNHKSKKNKKRRQKRQAAAKVEVLPPPKKLPDLPLVIQLLQDLTSPLLGVPAHYDFIENIHALTKSKWEVDFSYRAYPSLPTHTTPIDTYDLFLLIHYLFAERFDVLKDAIQVQTMCEYDQKIERIKLVIDAKQIVLIKSQLTALHDELLLLKQQYFAIMNSLETIVETNDAGKKQSELQQMIYYRYKIPHPKGSIYIEKLLFEVQQQDHEIIKSVVTTLRKNDNQIPYLNLKNHLQQLAIIASEGEDVAEGKWTYYFAYFYHAIRLFELLRHADSNQKLNDCRNLLRHIHEINDVAICWSDLQTYITPFIYVFYEYITEVEILHPYQMQSLQYLTKQWKQNEEQAVALLKQLLDPYQEALTTKSLGKDDVDIQFKREQFLKSALQSVRTNATGVPKSICHAAELMVLGLFGQTGLDQTYRLLSNKIGHFHSRTQTDETFLQQHAERYCAPSTSPSST